MKHILLFLDISRNELMVKIETVIFSYCWVGDYNTKRGNIKLTHNESSQRGLHF